MLSKEALCDPAVSGPHTGNGVFAEILTGENLHQILPYSPGKALYGIKHTGNT